MARRFSNCSAIAAFTSLRRVKSSTPDVP